MPLLIGPDHLEGKTMDKIQNIPSYAEPKTITKQMPLFEEEDDGSLIPYVKGE